MGSRITVKELAELFGENIPMVAVKILAPEKSEPLTIDEVRAVMKALALQKHAEDFIKVQDISCVETIYQTDRVIANGYDFIGGVCEIVGYHRENDE